MAEKTTGEMQATLGLTGLTMNAMALIAPGAFLWLTFYAQATEGATSPAMWIGIVFALLLCLATAVCYAEMAKLYPGTGSSYYFAEQSFLNHDKAWRYRPAFEVHRRLGLASLLLDLPRSDGRGDRNFLRLHGRNAVAELHERFEPGPDVHDAGRHRVLLRRGLHRAPRCEWLDGGEHRHQRDSDFRVDRVLRDGHRLSHEPCAGQRGLPVGFDNQRGLRLRIRDAIQTVNGQKTDVIVRDANMVPQPKLDAAGKPVPYHVSYPDKDSMGNFLTHPNAKSVVGIHNFGWMFVQATVAILILVGFESVTSLGGEAKNAKRDVPIAVITSLLVQGAFCYLFEYFAANYFLNSGYTMQSAAGSAAPIGDMMVMVGDALFGSGHGRTFMLIEAVTVFLALIGTTLSCINTGARVTYAMGKDQEVPEHFGMLHDKNLSPHRAIWTLGGDFRGLRVPRAAHGVRRCRRSDRCCDPGLASRLLVELRIPYPRQDGGACPTPCSRSRWLRTSARSCSTG